MADLKSLAGVSEKDRRMIEQAETLLGPEPHEMGFVKNLFWGRVREDLLFPYPTSDPDETARCDALLARLDDYLEHEHPSVQIDQEQEIPRWCIDRLFEIGVLGMTIPREYGGGGFGITSYNRVLERIGRSCGSTAVMVSAHQSIGCKAIVLFGTDEQKQRWLPHLATDWLSAFCLSEPNVGCDAGGQETRCELSPDGQYYILNGEKKWATSGALSKIFTVVAKQQVTDPKTGKTIERITALVCTPEMEGVDIYQKNRSKCGIRGTWQARIRFNNVRVPRSHLLGAEGKGLNIALTCLNYGRCTLSAGMLGGARRAFEQAVKWAQTRYQFGRPLADFELVRAKIARMSAYLYAMDAVLYLTTAMLDRHDPDIMLETAICKLFCSEMGWRVVNDAMQIMGGEGYMTENQVERIFRDSRINLIVEGANEVMQSFIFAYGGKQLAEHMLGVQQAIGWDHHDSPLHNLRRIFKGLTKTEVWKAAAPLGAELLLGVRPPTPTLHDIDPSLRSISLRWCHRVREHSHAFKVASARFAEQIVSRQSVQARLADSAMWLHAWGCVMSAEGKRQKEKGKREEGNGDVILRGVPRPEGSGNGVNASPVSEGRPNAGLPTDNRQLTTDNSSQSAIGNRQSAIPHNGHPDPKRAADYAAALYFMEMADAAIHDSLAALTHNADPAMLRAADAALEYVSTLPDSDYSIPEASPIARGRGKKPSQSGIKQFPPDRRVGVLAHVEPQEAERATNKETSPDIAFAAPGLRSPADEQHLTTDNGPQTTAQSAIRNPKSTMDDSAIPNPHSTLR